MTKAPYKGRFAKRERKEEGEKRKVVVTPGRFELTIFRLKAWLPIQLVEGAIMVRVAGLEPATYRLKGDYSTTELHALIN